MAAMRPRRLWRWRPSGQGVATALVVLFCGGLVAYPIVYLVAESLNTGDPGTFPPESIGLDNFTNLIEDSRIISNTAFVACVSTVMALGSFAAALVLGVPGRFFVITKSLSPAV